MRRISWLVGALLALSAAARLALAQDPVAPPQPLANLLTGDQLDQLLAPIALYPDPMLALILTAAEEPVDIVLADRYVSGGGDPTLISQQPWSDSPSVQALAAYPAELKMLDDGIAWTTQLGQAYLNQPQDVMDSIQRLRAQASAVGTLQSTPQEQVLEDDGTIEIVPSDPSLYYTPIYDAATAYRMRSPLSFSDSSPVGPSFNHDLDWKRHQVIVWNNDHPRPTGWWHQPAAQRQPIAAAPAQAWPQPARAPITIARRIDRGYEPSAAPAPAAVYRPQPAARPAQPIVRPAQPIARPTEPIARPAQPIVRPPEPIARPAAPIAPEPAQPARAIEQPRGALLGIESAQATRQYSSRGEQSSRSAPPPQQPQRPAAPPPQMQPGRRR
jgi:hypothetical protein